MVFLFTLLWANELVNFYDMYIAYAMCFISVEYTI